MAGRAGKPGPPGEEDLEPVPHPQRDSSRKARRPTPPPGHRDRSGTPDRRSGRDDHLRGFHRCDSLEGPASARRSGAQDHHHRRCGLRGRHRSVLVPVRARARDGRGDGNPLRRRNHPHLPTRQRKRGPLPCHPEFLRNPRLHPSPAGEAPACKSVRQAHPPALHRSRAIPRRAGRGLRAGPRCAGLRRGGRLRPRRLRPHHGTTHPRSAARSAITRGCRSTTAPCRAAPRIS